MIKKVIKKALIEYEMTMTDLINVKALKLKRARLYRHFKNPATWTLGELNDIYDYLRIPESERVYK